jgi:hypothetical protein
MKIKNFMWLLCPNAGTDTMTIEPSRDRHATQELGTRAKKRPFPRALCLLQQVEHGAWSEVTAHRTWTLQAAADAC